MKNITPDLRASDVVKNFPNTKDVFEKFSSKFLNDEKNISVIAKEENIILDELLSSLEEIVNKSPVKKDSQKLAPQSLTEIIDYTESNYHAFLWEKLPSIDMMINKMIENLGEKDFDFLNKLRTVFSDLKINLENHIESEEETIFDYAKNIEKDKKRKPQKSFEDSIMVTLYNEHQNTLKVLNEIKDFTNDFRADEGFSSEFIPLYDYLYALDQNLRSHIELENSVLFPRIEKLL